MSRELTELLTQHAAKNTKKVTTSIGELEIMELNAGHTIELAGLSGAEFQLACAALSLSDNGRRHADEVGFATALKQVKALGMTVALPLGAECIAFSRIGEEAVEEAGKE